jgi:hypothetical protein
MFAMMADDFADRVTWVSVNTHEDTHDYKGKYDVTVVPTLVAVIKDANGKDLSVTKHSGTTVPPYFHLVRFAVINSKKDAVERAA